MKILPHIVIYWCFFSFHSMSFASYFSLPLDCNEGCILWNYLDQDTSGGLQDWNCDSNTYNGHHGTDIGLEGTWDDMDKGVNIFAAADGKVISTLDGVDDHCTTAACCDWQGPSGASCGWGFGNHVRIQHDSGLLTIYAHMKINTVAVSTGEQVKCGDILGKVGSSGNSTGPHLHFEVRENNLAVDPYKGNCGNSKSLWISQGAYNDLPTLTCEAGVIEEPEPEPEEPDDSEQPDKPKPKPEPEPEPEPTRPPVFTDPEKPDYTYNAARFFPVGGESSNNTHIRLGFGYQVDLMLLFENTSDTEFNDIDHVTLKKESGDSPFGKDEFPMIKKDLSGTFTYTIHPHDIFRYEISVKAGNQPKHFQSIWRNHHGDKGFFGQAISFDITYETPSDDAIPILDRDMPNGYAVAPGEKLLKRFKYQNAGNIPWQGFDNVYSLKHIQGENFGIVSPIPLTKTATIIPSDNVVFTAYLQTPLEQGDYRGTFGFFYQDSPVGDTTDIYIRVISDPKKRVEANKKLLGQVVTYSAKYQPQFSQNSNGVIPTVGGGSCGCSQHQDKEQSFISIFLVLLSLLSVRRYFNVI